MPLMHEIMAEPGEWNRIEEYSQKLTGADGLITLISDGLDGDGNVVLDDKMWRDLDEKTLALLGWNEEPPLPWDDKTFRTYWSARWLVDAQRTLMDSYSPPFVMPPSGKHLRVVK